MIRPPPYPGRRYAVLFGHGVSFPTKIDFRGIVKGDIFRVYEEDGALVADGGLWIALQDYRDGAVFADRLPDAGLIWEEP